MISYLRNVQDYDEHETAAAAAADGDDDDGDNHYYSMSGVSLTEATVTAKHLYALSRRIKSTLRQELQSTAGLSYITADGY